jgi:PRC-barrel domain
MHGHSRWAAALMGAAFIVAMASPASARSHHRGHPADRVNPAAQPAQVPASGMRSNDELSRRVSEVANTGKTGLTLTLGVQDAEAILGKSVHSSTGDDMGRLVDVVVDTDGRPRAAIIDFGGFLGVGSRKIAVDWSALKFVPNDPKGNVITVALTRDQVKAAPEFKEGSPVVALGAQASPPPPPAPPPPAAPPQAREK